jgi:phosphoribosylformimino-5-aminoimidazole carboxamide ribotide isomerase
MRSRGVERIVYTDIERDGTFSAPNFDETARVAEAGVAVIASGGVGARAHLRRLAGIAGVEAVIVGTALYTGDVVLGPDEWEWRPSNQPRGEQHVVGK